MENLGLYPKLTKDYILERVSEEEIMEFYMDIPVIDENFYGNSFRNPFRVDDFNTCNYYYDKKTGKLRFRDFSGRSSGSLDRLFNADIFDVVGFRHKLNPNTKEGFFLILNIIAKDFKLHKYKDNDEEILKINNFINKQKNKKERLKVIKVAPRKWNKGDELYWFHKYGISSKTLKEHKVYPIQELFIEDRNGFINRYYIYKYNDPAYAYYGGQENGIHIWKIYFPMRSNNKSLSKVITNKSFIQGLDTFLPCRIGVVTKSYKDVMVLKEFGIQAICLSSESTPLTTEEYWHTRRYCDFLVSLLDYDKAGIRMANYLKKQFGIKPLMLTRGKYGKPDYGVKDISDFREMYGKQKTLDLINKSIVQLSDFIEYSKQLNKILWK